MATAIGFDPGTYNSNTVGPFTLGQIYDYQGRLYRFFQNATDAAIADGDVCVFASATNYLVTGASRTSALGGATTFGGPCAGVGVGAISQSVVGPPVVNYFGFLLVLGLHTNVKGIATVTVRRKQAASATAVSGVDAANGYDSTFGEAVSTLSGGRYSAQVKCI